MPPGNRSLPPVNLDPDCISCAALCCAVFAFDKSESFGVDKAAGEVCPNLTGANLCRIFEDRANAGFRGCVSYTCYGAGQRVTQEVFGGKTWRDDPALMHRMGAALSVLRRVHEQLVLLRAARHLPLAAEDMQDLEDLEARLMPESGWTEADLESYPVDKAVGEVSDFLQALKRLFR